MQHILIGYNYIVFFLTISSNYVTITFLFSSIQLLLILPIKGEKKRIHKILHIDLIYKVHIHKEISTKRNAVLIE